MVLIDSTGLDITMASDGSSRYSHQAVPHDPHVSVSASLHSAQTVLLLLLFPLHLSTIHLIVIVDPALPTWQWGVEEVSPVSTPAVPWRYH